MVNQILKPVIIEVQMHDLESKFILYSAAVFILFSKIIQRRIQDSYKHLR